MASLTLAETAKHKAHQRVRLTMFRVERQQLFQHGHGGLETLHADERGGGLPQKLAAVEARRRIVGQRQDVARPAVQLRDLDARLPVGEYFSEILGACRLDVAPIDGHQPDQLFIDGASDGLLFSVQRAAQDRRQPLDFGIEALLPRLVAFLFLGDEELPVVIERAIGRDVKRSPASTRHES